MVERRIYISKFFTYEERLELQKCLKESLSFKEISRRPGKNPTTIFRKVRKYSFKIATGNPVNHELIRKGGQVLIILHRNRAP